KKIDCGAHYFITQPLYSTKQIEEVYEATKHLTTPVYIGIMPLTSARNARFIHHEVPGIKLSEGILERMDATGSDRIRGEVEGLAIAKNLIDTAYELFDGIYLITPFMRYEMTEILTRYIHDKQLVTSERKI
ncbi:methylenetetrahydrofolate reductase, partial [Priestia megaterium]